MISLKRSMMIETACEEYLEVIGEIHLKQAERAFIPSFLPTDIQYRDKFLVHRETSGR